MSSNNSINNSQNDQNNYDTNETPTFNFKFNLGSSFGFILFPLICILIFTALVLIFTNNYRKLVITHRINKAVKKDDYKEAIALSYLRFMYMAKKKLKKGQDNNISASELSELLCTHFQVKYEAKYEVKEQSETMINTINKEIQTMTDTANQSLYSKNNNMSKSDYQLFINQLNHITKELRTAP